MGQPDTETEQHLLRQSRWIKHTLIPAGLRARCLGIANSVQQKGIPKHNRPVTHPCSIAIHHAQPDTLALALALGNSRSLALTAALMPWVLLPLHVPPPQRRLDVLRQPAPEVWLRQHALQAVYLSAALEQNERWQALDPIPATSDPRINVLTKLSWVSAVSFSTAATDKNDRQHKGHVRDKRQQQADHTPAGQAVVFL